MNKKDKTILAVGFLVIGYLLYKKIDQQKKDIDATKFYYETKNQLENGQI